MSDHPSESGPGVELDRVDKFPEIDEKPRPFWLLAVQFFILPMVIALMAVMVYIGASALTRSEKGIPELLNDIESGGRNKRWHAAYELSGRLKENKGEIEEADRSRIINLFDRQINRPPGVGGKSKADRRLERYLAGCLAYLADPRSAASLKTALSKEDPQLRLTCVVALGHLQQPEHIPAIADVLMGAEKDAEVRVVAAYTLGSLARVDAPAAMRGADWGKQVKRARTALHQAMKQDGNRQVRWNATVALASTGDKRAAGELGKLLDIEQLRKVEIAHRGSEKLTPQEIAKAQADERMRATANAARAAGKLGDRSLIPALKKLLDSESTAIRSAALAALEAIGQPGK